jgi:hypothetical protein
MAVPSCRSAGTHPSRLATAGPAEDVSFPRWLELPVDQLSEPGFVLVLGEAEGDAPSKAKKDAVLSAHARAASIVRTKIREDTEILERSTRSTRSRSRQGVDQTSPNSESLRDDEFFVLSDSTYSRAVTSRVEEDLRGGVEIPPVVENRRADGKWHVALRLRYPRDVLFPQEALREIAESGIDAPERARKALDLAQRYRAEGREELASRAARIAAGWHPTPQGLQALADADEARGDWLAAVITLERLSDLLDSSEASRVLQRAERLRAKLASVGSEIDAIVRRVEEHARTPGLAVECRVEGRSFAPAFYIDRESHLTTLWIDGDGVAIWKVARPEAADRNGRGGRWSRGRHSILPLETSWSGPATILWFATDQPFDLEEPLSPAFPWTTASETARHLGLRRVREAVEASLSRPETRSTLCRVTP